MSSQRPALGEVLGLLTLCIWIGNQPLGQLIGNAALYSHINYFSRNCPVDLLLGDQMEAFSQQFFPENSSSVTLSLLNDTTL